MRTATLRMDPFRSLVGAVLLLACSTPTLQAQLDPSNVVPNYDRIRVGQVEGLEGGAYVARTADGGANWYNPAGLALAAGTSLNASANAYEFTTIRLEGLNREFSSGRFQSLGTYFAGVIGSPILKGDRLRLGFSFTRPVAWDPGAVSGQLGELEEGTGGESLEFYTESDFHVSIPALAAGYRVSEGFRVGLGVGVPITSFRTNNQYFNRLIVPSSAERVLRTVTVSGQAYQLQFTGGVQWDLTSTLRVGATITTPGLGLGGSALLATEVLLAGPDGSTDVSYRDPEADFKYPLPLRVVGGIAASLGRFEVEANVRYHGSRDRFDLLASDETFVQVDTDASGQSVIVRRAPQPAQEEVRSVANLALGGNMELRGSWKLHGGIFTDNSPVGDPDSSQFQVADLTGVGLAVSFGGQLSGTVGVSSSWGATDDRSFGPTLGGTADNTEVTIRTVSLHYALSYTFN